MNLNFDTPLTKIFRINSEKKKTLERMNLITISDLLYYLPVRYGDYSKPVYLGEVIDGQECSFYAKILKIEIKKTFKTGVPVTEAWLEDLAGDRVKAIWFHQAYLGNILKEGSLLKVSGKIYLKKGSRLVSNPEFEVLKNIPLEKTDSLFGENEENFSQTLFPVYKESGVKNGKISSKWIYHKIKKILSDKDFLENLNDPIPKYLLEKLNLPKLSTSFFYLHLPQKESDYEVARKRFAFEEIFYIQLIKKIERRKYKESGAFLIKPAKKEINDFLKNLEFDLTAGQKDSIESILKDFSSGFPMSRLLEGDVGSGKTIVAMAAAYFTSLTRPKGQNFGFLQTAYMAPTEILAKQVFREFIKILKKFNLKIILLTSKEVRLFPSKINPDESIKISKKKAQEMILNGEIHITVGTHALISKKVFFENLGLVIIDEQHRFGKKQRAALRQKPEDKKKALKNKEIKKSEKIIKKGLADNDNLLPHLLSMTATPIPRTLALSLYGDLDLSIIDEIPPGRKKVKTKVYLDNEENRKVVYEKVLEELKKGRQAYVICPRISDPDENKIDNLNMKSAVSIKEKLEKSHFFKGYKIGLLHSKMKKNLKDEVMNDFLENKYQILVSTSVVEVGVSVPNASLIIIEGGERFGLSQLHQFRGRVQRGKHQPYCYIFSNTKNKDSLKRLSIIEKVWNGFKLAEYDLKLRGAGEILGNKQSGISDLAMESIKNLKMVEIAGREAEKLIENDKYLKHDCLIDKLNKIKNKIYME